MQVGWQQPESVWDGHRPTGLFPDGPLPSSGRAQGLGGGLISVTYCNQLLCELRGQVGGVHDRFSFLLLSRSFPLTPTSSPQWKTAPCRTQWCPGNWPISERGMCQTGCSREASPHPGLTWEVTPLAAVLAVRSDTITHTQL